MKLLCDENFPPRVQKDFVGHECAHVVAIGWAGTLNGELLTKAEEAGFEVLVTLDANLPAQNEVAGRNISVYVLLPEGQGIKETQALMGEVLVALKSYKPGEVKVFTNRTRGTRTAT